MIIIPFGFMAPGAIVPPASDLLLNDYPYSSGAFALRKLDKNYTGSCIKVRESGGDTLADIGFDANGDLDTTALLAHTGGNSGYVHTWYDQSGLGYNIEQTTTTTQPQIVNAGSVIETNSKPAMLYDGVDDFMIQTESFGFYGSPVEANQYSVQQMQSSDTVGIYINGQSNVYYWVYTSGDASTAVTLNTGTVSFWKNGNLITSPTRGSLFTNFNTDTQTLATLTGLDMQYFGTSLTTNLEISDFTSGYKMNAYIQELLFYREGTTDRYGNLPIKTLIEGNVGRHYLGWSDYSLFSTEFDGVDDYVDLGRVEPSTTALSISLWVYATSTDATQGLFTKYSSNDYGVTLWGGTLYFFLKTSAWDSISVASYTTTYLNQWTHICCTWDGSTRKIYINGSEAATGAKTGSITYSTNNTRIGDLEGASGWEFSGNIDEVAIWGSGLSPSNVTTIYNSGVPADITDLSPTAWYRMGDESGHPYLTNKMAYSKYSTYFDGVNDYVDLGDTNSFEYDDAFSISLWVLPEYTTNRTYIAKINNSPNTSQGYAIDTIAGAKIRFWIGNNYWGTKYMDVYGGTSVVGGTWYHVVCTYDGSGNRSGMKIYVNAVAETLTTGGAISLSDTIVSSSPLRIGVSDTSNHMSGNIDEVSIFNTALPATGTGSVDEIYNNGVPNDISSLNPIAYYKMGEGAIFPQIPNEMAYSKKSLYLDGVSGVVTLPTFATILGTTNVFSVSLWVNPAAFSNYDGFIGSSSNNSWTNGFGIGYNSGSSNMSFWINTYTNSATGAYAITSNFGKWVHVVGVYDGTLGSANTKIYINGVLGATTDDFTANVNATGNNIVIGRVNNPPYAHAIEANFDDVSIFSTALSEPDVTSIYNNGAPNDISSMGGLVSYYKMGDGDYFPTMTDSVGSNDGTVENMSGADIELDTPNGWGTAYNETAAEMIQGDTPGGNGGTMMINMTQSDIVQDAPMVVVPGAAVWYDYMDPACYTNNALTATNLGTSTITAVIPTQWDNSSGHLLCTNNDATFAAASGQIETDNSSWEWWWLPNPAITGTNQGLWQSTGWGNPGPGIQLHCFDGPVGYPIDLYVRGSSHTGWEADSSIPHAWTHIVITYEGTTATLYINGVEFQSGTVAAIIDGTGGTWGLPFNIGGSYMDIWRIYHSVLTPAEILHNFNVEKSRFGL